MGEYYQADKERNNTMGNIIGFLNKSLYQANKEEDTHDLRRSGQLVSKKNREKSANNAYALGRQEASVPKGFDPFKRLYTLNQAGGPGLTRMNTKNSTYMDKRKSKNEGCLGIADDLSGMNTRSRSVFRSSDNNLDTMEAPKPEPVTYRGTNSLGDS